MYQVGLINEILLKYETRLTVETLHHDKQNLPKTFTRI